MGIERERLEAIAYHALWQLRDLDPESEPAYVKATRLYLHDCLDDDVPQPPSPAEDRHLAVVG